MAKKNNYPGDQVNPPREKVSPDREKTVSITYRENRKFSLHVGRENKIFRGKQTKEIPASWLKHRDFDQVKHYFIVKGV